MSRSDRRIALSHLGVAVITLLFGGGLARNWEPLRTLLRVDESATQAAYNRAMAVLHTTRGELDTVKEQLQDSQDALAQARFHEDTLMAELGRTSADLRRAEREIDALVRLGECIHDSDARRPPRRLDSVAGCAIETKLQWNREIRFYGRRSPIRVGDHIVLAVVPDRLDTGSFSYQWDVSQCWGGRTNGATTGPIFAFTMTRAESSCVIDLHDAHHVYRLSYYATR